MADQHQGVLFILSGILTLIGGVIFFFGFKKMGKISLIENVPRSKVRSMAMGLVEIEGTAAAENYIKAPFSQSPCVYYRYRIEEYREHFSRDSKGNAQRSYRWDTIATGEQRPPFLGKDETGQVYINPIGAEFNVTEKNVFLQRAGIFGGMGNIINELKNWDNNQAASLNVSSWGLSALEPASHTSFGGSVGDRKYFEYFIAPQEALFIIGTAANEPQAPGGVSIKRGENEPTFIISNSSEKQLLNSLTGQMVLCFVSGGLMVLGGIFLILKTANLI